MFELILGNLVIRLLIGSAFAVLMAALLITLKNYLRAANAKRAERRAERAHALALALEQEGALAEAENPATAVAGKSILKAVATPAGAKPSPTTTPSVVAPTNATATNTAQPDATAAPAPEAQAAEATNSAMQDILSSVFGDEEVSGHPQALLAGLKDLNAGDLLTLATRVATQLNAHTATMNEKEI